MSAATRPTYGAGAASVARIHDGLRTGSIKLATPPRRREPMTSDPLRLDSGIPTLTERHAARHHRNAPHLHLVHRVDTATDLPAGVDGVAIGYAALPEEAADTLRADEYERKPIAQAQQHQAAYDRKVVRTIASIYAGLALALIAVVVGARNQVEIRAALKWVAALLGA